jgi:hypothetical protein
VQKALARSPPIADGVDFAGQWRLFGCQQRRVSRVDACLLAVVREEQAALPGGMREIAAGEEQRSVSRVRARVMDLAQSFAGWVAERRGQTPEAVLAHQGATIYATRALETGLADGIGTLADAISTAAELAAQRHIMQQTEQQLAAIAAALGAGSPEEALATIATMRKRAEAAETAERELATVRAELAQRDAAAAAQARETVLSKHRSRGALTPAMEADSAYLADLAPLSAEALDRVLSKLPGAPTRVEVKRPEDKQPGADAETITATDREWASRFGVKTENMQRAVQRDRERATARGLADTE